MGRPGAGRHPIDGTQRGRVVDVERGAADVDHANPAVARGDAAGLLWAGERRDDPPILDHRHGGAALVAHEHATCPCRRVVRAATHDRLGQHPAGRQAHLNEHAAVLDRHQQRPARRRQRYVPRRSWEGHRLGHPAAAALDQGEPARRAQRDRD
jgi:hypothetical protein